MEILLQQFREIIWKIQKGQKEKFKIISKLTFIKFIKVYFIAIDKM